MSVIIMTDKVDSSTRFWNKCFTSITGLIHDVNPSQLGEAQ